MSELKLVSPIMDMRAYSDSCLLRTAFPFPALSMMTSPDLPITLVLADARELFRGGLQTAIANYPELAVIGSVATLDQALALCLSRTVSVLVLGDLLLGRDLSGAPALIAALPAATRTLLICSDQSQAASMIEQGFWGCLPQTASGAEVIRAVQAVAEGELWAPRRVLSYLIRERQCGCMNGALGSENGAHELTPREAEILELVARGLNNDQIAAALFIGRSTVKTHLLRSFRKLEAVDRTSAVTIALRRKLIGSSED